MAETSTNILLQHESISPSNSVKKLGGLLVSIVLLAPLPWMALVIAVGLIWDQAWLRFRKTAAADQIGNVLARLATKVARGMMKDERDAPYLYSLFGIGVYTPALFAGCLYWQLQYGDAAGWWTAVLVAFAYHVLMMGPYFRFFAYISTLVHKEGHAPRGLFKDSFRIFNKAFGWFLGPFYGHVPEAYPLGHLRIHHKHDNGPEDVTSTLEIDRSQPSQWLVYLRQFTLYWTGISIVSYFARRRQWPQVRKMSAGMFFYYGAMATFMLIDPWFGFAYFMLPHLCVIIYLAAINYTWHTFSEPGDPENEYVNSVTILNGHYNVFNEDYHVTHHQRPQLHWTQVPQDFEKNLAHYRDNRASLFTDTQEFEMFTWIMMKRFDLLAQHFVDLSGELSEDEKIALLVRRMKPAIQAS